MAEQQGNAKRNSPPRGGAAKVVGGAALAGVAGAVLWKYHKLTKKRNKCMQFWELYHHIAARLSDPLKRDDRHMYANGNVVHQNVKTLIGLAQDVLGKQIIEGTRVEALSDAQDACTKQAEDDVGDDPMQKLHLQELQESRASLKAFNALLFRPAEYVRGLEYEEVRRRHQKR